MVVFVHLSVSIGAVKGGRNDTKGRISSVFDRLGFRFNSFLPIFAVRRAAVLPVAKNKGV
jgi:hypothetical protein